MAAPEEILEKLRPIFEKIFDDDVDLTMATSADHVSGWDSLTHVRLILMIEKAFRIRFAAAEVAGFKNVGDLVYNIAART